MPLYLISWCPRETDQTAYVKIEEGRDLLALLLRVRFVRMHRIQLHGEIKGRFARQDLSRRRWPRINFDEPISLLCNRGYIAQKRAHRL